MRHLTVREIMSDGGICRATPGTSVRAACCLMARHQCGSVVVVERDRLLGIFTQGDLVRRVLAAGLDPNLTLLVEVMTKDPDTIDPRVENCGYGCVSTRRTKSGWFTRYISNVPRQRATSP
jgi:CBS domain-containing protein